MKEQRMPARDPLTADRIGEGDRYELSEGFEPYAKVRSVPASGVKKGLKMLSHEV